MHRTNIYLSDELRGAVARRASRLGVSNSAVIRSALELSLLGGGDECRDEAQAALREVAPVLRRYLDEGFADDPDLRVE